MERFGKLLARDPGGRGVAALHAPGDISHAARVLAGAQSVLLLTGFAVGPDGVAETDGPPGALFLGRALMRLGKSVAFATHRSCAPVMAAGIEALRLRAPLEAFGPGEPADHLLERYTPDAVVAIELPGRAADGHYYNMRGLLISHRTAPLDGLLLMAGERLIPTIAVGDGGNEAGMGKVIEQVRAAVSGGEKIASVVAADSLIAAGTSNWGAYGLLAALDGALLHGPEEETALLESLVRAGALDGVRLEAVTTVDGIPADEYLRTLIELRRLALAA